MMYSIGSFVVHELVWLVLPLVSIAILSAVVTMKRAVVNLVFEPCLKVRFVWTSVVSVTANLLSLR
jgi:hypothetical protein